MTQKLALLLALAALLGIATPPRAAADDTDLLNRATPSPNVLVIFDTSQSMTWYRATGATRGDEYPGWTGDNSPAARMAMAKSVMSTVVDTYFDKLRLGLASYNQGGTPANPNANVRIRQYHYYCGYSGTYCTNAAVPSPNRQYFTISPSTALNTLKLWVDSTNLNMPTQNTFTLAWNLDPGVSSNPRLNTSTSPAVTYCTWDVVETQYDRNGTVKSGYPRSYTENRETTTNGAAGCKPKGTTGTLTQREAYRTRAAGDDPNPYKYDILRSWTGYAVYGAGCATPGSCTAGYSSNLGAGWTDYTKKYTYNGKTTFYPASTSYSWTYYYKGTCTSGCSGYLTTSRTTNWQAASSPVLPSPLVVPFTRVYTWSGNNYERNLTDQADDNTCQVGLGISVLMDVGGAADKNALKNYFGTGPDKKLELHGANYYTPLATALDTARTYFLSPDGVVQQDPQKDCRGNYVILVTDGGESCPLVPLTGAGSPGEKALALRTAPINSRGGAITYVVALDGGSFSQSEQDVLRDIAAKGSEDGDGTYYSASTPATLLAALNAIIGNILSQTYSFVTPVIPSLRTSDNLMLVQGSFTTPSSPPEDPNTPIWPGSLSLYPLNEDGKLDIDAQRIATAAVWEAGALLAARASATRNLKTVLGGLLVNFDPLSAALQTALAVTVDADGNGVVNGSDAVRVAQAVRGRRGPGQDRAFLGDIFHSNPIIVGPPSPTFVDRTFNPSQPDQLLSLAAAPDTFAAFRKAQSTRQRLVLVGTNAGVLHAFNAGTFNFMTGKYTMGDGTELWGFIPPQMLPKLQWLAVNNGHQYFVDGSPRVADVWLDANNDGVKAPDGSEWRTVLVGGFRQGGTGLYALDITNTASPQFLWTFPTSGQSWSEPTFGKVKVRIGGRLVDRWVAFVGDGYDPTGVNGRKIHVIDVKTGRALFQYATASSVAATPTTIDINNDGYVDRVYVGTVGGDIIRLDVSAVGQNASGGDVDPAAGVMVANWSGRVFFSAGAAQPFYTRVAATVDPDGNLWTFVGSGDRPDPLAVPATRNRVYGIKDPYPNSTATLTEADLNNMTSNNTLDASAVTGAGWYVVLRAGEKEIADASLVFNRQVFFTTFTPGDTTCGDVGSGAIYMVYYLTGGGVSDAALFQGSPPQASSRIYQINAGLTSRPVITTGAQGSNAVVYLGNSNMLTLTPSFSVPTTIRATRYWRRVLP